ncbi:hypothetical protein GCM10028805_26400 [Spirosoma harenae]
MKSIILLIVCLALSGTTTWGQTRFRLDSIPPQGILLDKAWKWKLGDQPEWAKTNFDDSHWDTFDPFMALPELTQLPQRGIGWLRLSIRVAPSWRGRLVSISLRQIGATELFLNGIMVAKNGVVNAHGQVEKGILFQSIPSIVLGPDSVQTLAIRYAFSRERLLNLPLFTQLKFFRMTIAPVEEAEAYRILLKNTLLTEYTLFGVFLILGVIQFSFLVSSRFRITPVYFGLFLMAQGATHFLDAFTKDGKPDFAAVTRIAVYDDSVNVVFCVAAICSALFYLLGVYAYFNQPKRRPFFITAILTLATIPAYLFSLFNASIICMLVMGFLVPYGEILRVGIRAIGQRKPGARLFTYSHAFLLTTFLFYTISVTVLGGMGNTLFLLSFLVLALTITLLLSQERAETNRLLQRQLLEVAALSEKTIAQEQEKQQMLATQNERLEQQVEARTAELKASQTQLIQKEKLASLGELTAGIAHEIQNPLNFVNNFSEVSTELIDELKEGPFQKLPDGEKQYAEEILGDLTSNLQKITHHGARASDIVKGMLDHSRTESGEKRPTDLNTLADEYLKIAYHGLRAKDKEFTCELITHFDRTLKPVEVAPQEIGRVLLNLYNNAFYAVREKQRTALADYRPTITVSTQQSESGIDILIRDNGAGIPDQVKTKIFQPFFTTKPTGQGTGLGLSLSYDIITKGHNGMLRVESQTGEGTTFFIGLPQQ